MINLNKTLVIIDGNSIINRAFYALPEMSNKEGLKTNAIYGYLVLQSLNLDIF